MSTEPTLDALTEPAEDPWFDSSLDGIDDPDAALANQPTSESLIELLGAVWSSFVDDETPLEPALSERPDVVISGEVSINGAWAGRLLVSFDPEGARQVAARMFLTPVEDVEQDDLYDTVGEVANMIGGNVKAMLDGDCQLGLPVVHPPESLPVPRQRAATVAEAELSWGGTWLAVVLESTAEEA